MDIGGKKIIFMRIRELYYRCKKCGYDYVTRNFIPEKIICLNCGTVYNGFEILKEAKEAEEAKTAQEKQKQL